MDFTSEFAKSYNLSPFDVLKQDKDYVIMLINYFIEKGQITSNTNQDTHTETKKNNRIRVNDKTATGGWF